jgi:hypothetical protein
MILCWTSRLVVLYLQRTFQNTEYCHWEFCCVEHYTLQYLKLVPEITIWTYHYTQNVITHITGQPQIMHPYDQVGNSNIQLRNPQWTIVKAVKLVGSLIKQVVIWYWHRSEPLMWTNRAPGMAVPTFCTLSYDSKSTVMNYISVMQYYVLCKLGQLVMRLTWVSRMSLSDMEQDT